MATALPPSRSTPSRASQVCAASAPLCPRCGEPIRRVHVSHGTGYGYCEALAPRSPGADRRSVSRDRARCGQHALVHGIGGGLCVVTPITRDEYAELSALEIEEDVVRPITIYRALGVLLRGPLGEGAP